LQDCDGLDSPVRSDSDKKQDRILSRSRLRKKTGDSKEKCRQHKDRRSSDSGRCDTLADTAVY